MSSIFGLCREGFAPGTVASFAALVASFATYWFLGKTAYILVLLASVSGAYLAIKKVQAEYGPEDHQWIGIDEWAGMWTANLFLFELPLPFGAAALLAITAFVLFRTLDILKFVPPLAAVNGRSGTLSVLLDDILSGLYAYFLMLVFLRIYDIQFLYASFLLLLPAMIANMAPTLLPKKHWTTPINEAVFGKNKTWRGFLSAVVFGTLACLFLVKIEIVETKFVLLAGFLLSFGAIGGDLLKSFFKRRAGIGPGESWPPFDQIDYVLGTLLLTYPLYHYSLREIVFMLILGGVVSALFHRLGYLVKINEEKQ